MDLYNLRDWNIGIDTWFDAGSDAEIQVGMKSRSLHINVKRVDFLCIL